MKFHRSSEPGNVSNSQQAKAEDKRIQELRKQIEQIASAEKGRAAVATAVLEAGESVSNILTSNCRFYLNPS